MIRAIIFDVGGVLIRTEDPTPRRQLEARLKLPSGGAETLFFNSSMGQKGQHGQVTTDALWQWVQSELGLSPAELAAFQRDFWAGDRLDTDLVDLIRRLRGPYQTAIISNALDNLTDVVTRLYPMADAFDLIVGSASEGIMKPDPRIFIRTLERLGCRPDEAVFIDDFQHNVDGARGVGMAAIHYTPGLDVAAALATLGVVTAA